MGASWILRTGAAAVTAVAFTLLLASGGGAGSVREGGTLRVVEAGLFNTIDPALIRHIPEGIILRAACAGLVGLPHKPLPEGLRVVPELAEALPRISRDGKTYTFTIRKDARFSDGRPVTARHFLHALERIMNPAMSSSQVPYFERIAGAKAMLEGKATRLTGVVARGRTLTIRLTQPTPDFVLLLAGPGTTLCAVPATLPVDAEGAKAPLASPAPYYVSRFVPGERVVLQRNRFYRGPRPHHLDRIVGELGVGLGVFDRVLAGTADYALGPPSFFSQNASTLARRYGVNKTQFFVATAPGMRLFALNASRPLFKGNVKLRQAINFAVDRRALIRELGPYAGAATDQYLPPTMPGHIAARIYPVSPDLRKARALAAGNRRSGKAVLYTTDLPVDVAQAEILKQNLAKIGIELDIQKYPIPLIFEKLATPGEPFDIGRITWGGIVDPAFLSFLFDGTSIGTAGFGNWSYFDSPKFNRMLKRAERIPLGPERYRLYGEIDVQLARDAAPAVAYGVPNSLTLVSVNVGCVIVNPDLDLTAACLK